MATNPFFNNYNNLNEQSLIDDLLIESIKIYGIDIYYMPRTLVNRDAIFSEDRVSVFKDAYNLEMYIKNIEGFEGERDIMTKFGLEVRDEITFSVARKRFKDLNINEPEQAPREGDVIYFPLTKSVYEIKFVQDEPIFYQLGKLQMYDVVCELMEYSDENFETEVTTINKLDDDFSYTIELQLGTGTGDYIYNEVIYQGTDFANKTASAQVISWNATAKKLKVKNITGDLSTTSNVIGLESGSSYTLSIAVNYINDANISRNPSDNQVIQETQVNDSIFDFSETDPFSEGNY